jgi:hypothetical protein
MTQALLKVDDLKAQLLSLDTVRERLAVTDGLSQHEFETDGSTSVTFNYPDGWNVGLMEKEVSGLDVTAATVTIGGQEFPLTKDAALEATSKLGITKDFALRTPGDLVTPLVNHWMHNGANGKKSLKLLAGANGNGLAFTSAALDPFSNERLLNEAIDAIESQYGKGVEILADYKFHHDLRRTNLRLIVPDQARHIASARAASAGDDPWSAGIVIDHSIIGEKPLTISGYMFAWWCTNGAQTVHAASGKHKRKVNQDAEEVYAWARQTVEETLGGLEHEFDQIEALPQVPLEEGELSQTMQAIYEKFKVPMDARSLVEENLINSNDLTAYGLMNAITQVANASDSMSFLQVQDLLQIGGEIPHVMADRCTSCHRI